MRKICFIQLFLCLLCSFGAGAQSLPDLNQLGGNYALYSFENTVYTKAPQGYKPFYISHYGRHGSRWLQGEGEYTAVLNIFRTAHEKDNLTVLGEDVYRRLILVWDDAKGHLGLLTPKGADQHREIAQRMVQNYPDVFAPSAKIQCNSTYVIRCILSMAAFTERLAALKPDLKINREAKEVDMNFLNPYVPYEENEASRDYAKFKKDTVVNDAYDALKPHFYHPERLLASLFKDGMKAMTMKKAINLMDDLQYIAIDLPNTALTVRLDDLFQPEEFYDAWQYNNLRFYLFNGPSPMNNGVVTDCSKPLLENFLDCADTAIRNGTPAANFRFGHDTSLIPFLALMDLAGCNAKEQDLYKVGLKWRNYEMSPMAGNIQWVFYRNKSTGDILVKFLLNEKEATIPVESDVKPYYHWKNVEAFYRSKIKEKSSE